MKKINTVLFDLDGTLINTIDLILASFLHTMEQYSPGEYSREDVIKFIGPPLRETFEAIHPTKVDEMVRTYRAFNDSKHDEMVTEYEGVIETLEALKARGMKMAIVTSKMRKTAVNGMKLMQLEDYFDVVVSLSEVTKHKPDPEPLEKALAQLDANASEAIMVGDSEHDILGGKNTGTYTAGVAWTIQGEAHLASFEPDVMLEKLEDLISYIDKINEER